MYNTKNHHPLLFSKWFPYFWKFVFKRTKGSYHQEFYGDAKKGYFCKLDNGLTYKIFKHSVKIDKDPLFAVYIYHHEKLIINYNTYSDTYLDIVADNPFSYTSDELVEGLVDALKKAFPENTLSIFDGNPIHFEKMPIFSFRISEYHWASKAQYKIITIKQFLDPTNRDKYDYITIAKRYNEYYSAKSRFGFGSHSTGFSKDFDKSLIESFERMDKYTSSNRYYMLYDLQSPKNLDKLANYKSIIVDKNTRGFLLDSDRNYFYFMFDYGFIVFHNYNYSHAYRSKNKDFEIISNDNNIELTFAKKLKEVMSELQRNKPSISFCNYLNELGIEGIDISKRNPLTDEQWLLYEMMSI